MTEFQDGTLITIMDCQMYAIGKAIRPILADLVTYREMSRANKSDQIMMSVDDIYSKMKLHYDYTISLRCITKGVSTCLDLFRSIYSNRAVRT